jgi:hypothetical protein
MIVMPSIAPLHGAVDLEALMVAFPPLPAPLVAVVPLVIHWGLGIKQAGGLHYINQAS